MKQVAIGVANGDLCLVWCDVAINDVDPDNWLIQNSQWTKYNIPINSRISIHIARLYGAVKHLSQFVLEAPIGEDELLLIPLVSVVAIVYQPENLEQLKDVKDDWIHILRFVQRMTNDTDLEMYIDASIETRGHAIELIDQEKRESEARAVHRQKVIDGIKRKQLEDKTKPPTLGELEDAFIGAMDEFGGYPMRGERDIFWESIAKSYPWWPWKDEDKNGTPLHPDHGYDWPPIKVVIKRCEGNIMKWRAKWESKNPK